MNEPAPEIRRPYCLRCYAALPTFAGARCVCERCGFVNVKHDLGIFWTKEKRFRDLEELAKTLIVLFLVGLGLVVALGLKEGSGIGTGQGWAVGFPILIGVILWETAEKITRRKPYFRAAIVWRVVFVILGGPIVLLGVATEPGLARVVVFAVGGALLFVALTAGAWSKRLAAWRDRRIRAGQYAKG